MSQVYAIIVLPNGGPDLEAYTFSSPSKNGWTQACSIFWQVAYSIADAEDLVSFEVRVYSRSGSPSVTNLSTTQHRDLHWGQILIQNLPTSSIPQQGSTHRSMDDYSSGVIATIIDLGLSRMDASPTEVHWTPFEPEVFEGEGDHQFDIYRMMRNHNGDSWKEYRPLTNVMVPILLLSAWDRIDWIGLLVATLSLAQIDLIKGITSSTNATEGCDFQLDTKEEEQSRSRRFGFQ